MPESGYRSPRIVRGLTLQGFNPVLVRNVAEAAALVAKTDGAIIAKVGRKAKSGNSQEIACCKSQNTQ